MVANRTRAANSTLRDRLGGTLPAAIGSFGGDSEFLLRGAGGMNHRGRRALGPGTYPPFTGSSSTANLIMDLW